MHRIAEQDAVAMVPVLVPDGRKPPPHRLVPEEPVALERFAEHLFAVRDGARFVRFLESGGKERLVRDLDDERRSTRLVLVGVRAPQTVLVLFEEERERRERPGRPEPDEAIGPKIDGRAEPLPLEIARPAVDPVRDHDQIRFRETVRTLHLHLVVQVHTELSAARGEQVEQALAGNSREAVPGRRELLPAEVDIDVIPVKEALADAMKRFRIRLFEVAERRIGEDHTESERLARSVPLVDVDLVPRILFLEKDREIESAGTAPDHHDAHATPFTIRSLSSARIPGSS